MSPELHSDHLGSLGPGDEARVAEDVTQPAATGAPAPPDGSKIREGTGERCRD